MDAPLLSAGGMRKRSVQGTPINWSALLTMNSDVILRTLSAERNVFVISKSGVRRKVFQIQFLKSDGSIVIHFPYHIDSEGIVARLTLKKGERGNAFKLGEIGKITTHKVKFVHHPDGEVHFSQDSKIRTTVRTKSMPLRKNGIHVFTIHVHGFDKFDLAKAKDSEGNPKRGVVTVTCEESVLALKIVGIWVFRTDFTMPTFQGPIGPVVYTIGALGKKRRSLLLAPPNGFPFDNHLLLLSFDTWDGWDRDADFGVSMIGGFDESEVIPDLTKDASFLALVYPVSDIEDVRRRIESIDL